MQQSTLIWLFSGITFLVIILVAGMFIFIKTPAAKYSLKNSATIDNAKTESFRNEKDQEIWLKELASIKNRQKSYSYPVQELYINLNSKQ